MKHHTFALVDCNNFYASCEQLFQPELVGRPVVVLGNNDGIVVARSRKARDLGVEMGVPYFKIQRVFEGGGGVAFSSNYTLYGDMSQRVMETLRDFTDRVEVYSIDEAFLDLDDAPQCLPALASEICRTVKQWTGLSVSIGLAQTKTLAKLANKVAKKGEGRRNLRDHPHLQSVLQEVPVEEVWGIGPKYRKLLQSYRIKNAFQLSQVDEKWARQQMTVMGQRTVLELKGIPCFRLDEMPPSKKAIARSRQFGQAIVDLDELYQPLAGYVASAARELRRQKSVAGAMRVSLETSRFIEHTYSNSILRSLPWPTAATGELIQWACQALERIYKPDYEYRRCGVMLADLAPEETLQTSLFTTEYYDESKKTVMEALDRITAEWGRHALRHAREGFSQRWRMRQSRRSPRYTTRWDELPVVNA